AIIMIRTRPVGVQSRSRYRQRLACTAPAVRKLHNPWLRSASRRQPSPVKRAASDLGRRQVGNTVRGKLPAGNLARRQIPDAFWRQLPGDNILRRVLVRTHRESRRLVWDVIPRRKLIRTASLSNVVRTLHAEIG